MKKRLIFIMLLTLCFIFALSSCVPNGGEGTSNAGGGQDEINGVLYAPGSSLSVVYADEDIFDFVNRVYYAVGANTDVTPVLSLDNTEISKHEVVIGETERAISKAAYRRLSRLNKESKYEVSYLVYTDGNSVAIAFEKDDYGYNVALDMAVSEFISYMGDSETLSLKSGNILYGAVDPIIAVEENDEKIIAERWISLESTIAKKLSSFEGPFYDGDGKEVDKETYVELVITELKNMYALYSDDVIKWFANLYEPNGGGYYFSNSARNTVGYLPDIESTSQALNFWAGSGMADSVGGTYADAIPEWMKEQIIYFVKNLQYPNGYFYHPQWGQELLDNKTSRRNRDLEWACGILSSLDAKPTYDTPSGMEGDGILANGEPVVPASRIKLTSRLPVSAAEAVLKVVATSNVETAISDNLKTKEAFEEYLEQIDIQNNCYGGGNELGTYASQIKERDKQLKEQNADWSPIEMVIDYLNENCYPETGHWSGVADYNGTNGLLKISGLYNSLGAELPYPLEAARSAIASITTDERAQTICYVYNAWYSVSNIIENLKNYSSRSDGAELAQEISSNLLADCVAGIVASRNKTATFRRDDGSFSYLTTGSSTNSQGMPVAVPQSLEGDVNATEIGIVGTWGHIFNALGISGEKIPIYTESDRIRYIRILEELGPVIKDPEDTEIDVLTFDDEYVNQDPFYVELNFKSAGFANVEAKDNSGEDKMLHFNSVSNGGDELTFACDSLRQGASCFAFKFDMKVDDATNGNFLQLSLGNRCYMLMFSNDASGIHISDISSGSAPRLMNDFGVTVGFDEWHNYKVEYYIGNEETVRIKVFVDNKLVGVTDNYYDATGARLYGKVGTPITSYTEASLLAMSYVDLDVYIDNVSCYKTNDIYQPITDPEKQPNVNVDATVDEHIVFAPANGVYFNDPAYAEYNNRFTYDFMGYPAPTLTGSAFGKTFSQSGMLVFERIAPSGNGETYIQYRLSAPEDLTAYNNYCSVYEFDYRVSEADLSYDNAPFRLDGGDYLRFVKNSDGKSWSIGKKDSAEINCGEWCNIRFEIYYLEESAEVIKIFVNGEYATELALGEAAPFNSRLIIYMKKNIEQGTVINLDNMIILHLDKAYVSDEKPSEDDEIEEAEIPTAPGKGVFYCGSYSGAVRKLNFSSIATSALAQSAAASVESVCEAGKYQLVDSAAETFVRLENQNLPTLSEFITVSEFDMLYKGYDTENISDYPYYFMPIRIYDAEGNNEYLRFVKNSDGTLSLEKTDAVKISAGEWFNVRLEFVYTDSGVEVDIYLNDIFVITKTLSKVTGTVTKTWITLNKRIYNAAEGAEQGAVYIDNLFYGHIDAAPTLERTPTTDTEEPTLPDTPVTPPDDPSFVLGSGVYYNSTADAKAYRVWNFNTTGSLNGFSGGSFATGGYVDGAAVLERTASDWSTASFYYNIADKEFTGDPTGATCKVFEFDYKISHMFSGSNDGRSLFRLDGDDYVKAYRNSDGVTLSLGEKDTALITPGEWCNLRFEFYNVDGVKYMQIYVNETYAYTQTLSDKTNTFNNRIYFYLEAATVVGCTVSVDNLVMAFIEKDFEAKQNDN